MQINNLSSPCEEKHLFVQRKKDLIEEKGQDIHNKNQDYLYLLYELPITITHRL